MAGKLSGHALEKIQTLDCHIVQIADNGFHIIRGQDARCCIDVCWELEYEKSTFSFPVF